MPTTHVRHDTEHFFASPWPSDSRVTDGDPDMQNFPNPAENPLITQFLDEVKKLNGFGTNSPIYIPLDSKPDFAVLPDEVDSLDEDSPIHIIDVDPTSPYRGERIPWRWYFQETQTSWQPAHLFAIAPTWGFALRPNTTYAVVISTAFVVPDQQVVDSLENNTDDIIPHFQDTIETWEYLEYNTDDIAFITTFTTQNPLQDLISIAQRIDTEISTPPLNPDVQFAMEGNGCTMYDGEILLPLWQYGEKPYARYGGGFAYDEDGRPRVFSWDRAYFRISVPNGDMPADGWPVAIYSHGTGGDYSIFADNTGELEPATIFAKAGILGIGISQPLHAERGTGADPELYSFNYLNPSSARTMFRQGAADQIYLAKLLSSRVHHFTLPDREIHTNPNNIQYVGHSHGGEVGALALPFLGKYIHSAVLSGAGGALSITLMERTEGAGVDIQQLLSSAIVLSENETLSPFHPAIALVQMLAEVTDPLNYARYWFHDPAYWEQYPVSVMMTQGLQDIYTPPASIEILAAAAKIPIVGTIQVENPAHQILGLPNKNSVQGNLLAFDDTKITGGLVQFPEDGHFAIFDNPIAGNAYKRFLATGLSELPLLSLEE